MAPGPAAQPADARRALLAAIAALAPDGAPTLLQADRPLQSFQVTIAGTPLTVRAPRPDDAALEALFVRELSADSRHQRFMAAMAELPAGRLRELAEIDAVRQVAWVATVQRGGGEAFAGVARCIADRSGSGCEFAVTVADAWQGSGLAGVLMLALIDAARARGLARMEGIVLSTDSRLRKLARQLGFSALRDPDDPRTMHVALAL